MADQFTSSQNFGADKYKKDETEDAPEQEPQRDKRGTDAADTAAPGGAS